jgi:hypothetical protein
MLGEAANYDQLPADADRAAQAANVGFGVIGFAVI